MSILGTQTYDNLIVGDDTITDSGVLITGQNLSRGALLGKITASGKLTLSTTANNQTFTTTGAAQSVNVGVGAVVNYAVAGTGVGAVGTVGNYYESVAGQQALDLDAEDFSDVSQWIDLGTSSSMQTPTDGSEVPYAVLNEIVDATATDKTCSIILSGEVNSNATTFGTGHTVSSTKDGLRSLGIIFKTSK